MILPYISVVDVKTAEADVISCFIFILLADVIANISVADVMATYYSTTIYNYISDLRKQGLVPGKSLSPATNFGSVLEKN